MTLLAALLLLTPFLSGAAAEAATGETCVDRMSAWILEQRRLFPVDQVGDPQRMLYFLHVPRTAGRTAHNCLLMPMLPPSRRCAKSYDGFKYNISLPDCGLISSHDDFSAMRQLPAHTAVYTSIRNPVDRFISAYEFSVELGSRDVVRRVSNPSERQGKVNTKNVWPWNYLQPVFAKDTQDKYDKVQEGLDRVHGRWVDKVDREGRPFFYNEHLNRTAWTISPEQRKHYVPYQGTGIDAYANELYMPLGEFTGHPDALELLHNGQTLQVLGLTNYSHDPQAAALRRCIQSDVSAASAALEYAKERLASFWHVGAFERMRLSLAAAAALLGKDLDGPTWRSNSAHAFSYDLGDGDDAAGREKGPDDFLDSALPKTEVDINRMLQIHGATLRAANKEFAEAKRLAKPQKVLDQVSQKLAMLEDKRDRLQVQLTNVKAGTQVVSRLEATGRARQLVSDDEHINPENKTVSSNFAQCESQAQMRAARKRESIISRLKRADGMNPQFSRAARQKIPADTLDAVIAANWMDMELHALALERITRTIEELEAAGRLQALPERQQVQNSQANPELQSDSVQERRAATVQRGPARQMSVSSGISDDSSVASDEL